GGRGRAGVLKAPPAGTRDEIVHHRAVGGEPPQRLLLVFGDELAVAGNIGSEDGRDFPVHRTLDGRQRRCHATGAAQWYRITGSRRATAPAPLAAISIAQGGG